jgi:inorganic phosphate transporter, PiT family
MILIEGRYYMTVSFFDFLNQVLDNPTLLITVVLTLGVILVNGWTDAPNAIATCVSTRAMKPGPAILMAAVFNFIGVFVMTMINANVAQTIYNMVDFRGDPHNSLIALCAALLAIVVWATAAWYFGIPTSESHALIAGISGAAIALQGGFEGINGNEWIKVIYGLILSTILGFLMGWITVKLVEIIFRGFDRRKTNSFFKGAQISGGAAMAFMHGAQDGQKFMGVFMLGIFLANGNSDVENFVIPIWLMVLCSLVMGLGTSIGGYKIIKAVGMDMVRLKQYQGFSADLAAAGCLLISSITGIPVSTTHTKTTSIMGVGAAKRLSSVNWGVVKEMIWTWVLTFPGCGIIGYLMAKFFIMIF